MSGIAKLIPPVKMALAGIPMKNIAPEEFAIRDDALAVLVYFWSVARMPVTASVFPENARQQYQRVDGGDEAHSLATGEDALRAKVLYEQRPDGHA